MYVCIKIVSMKEQKSNRKLNFWSWTKVRSIPWAKSQLLRPWQETELSMWACIKTVRLRNSDLPAYIWPIYIIQTHDMPGDPEVEKYHTNLPKMNEHMVLPHRNPWNCLYSQLNKSKKIQKIINVIKIRLSKVTKHMKNIMSSLLAQTGKSEITRQLKKMQFD